jgi:hypothetical protein
VRRRINRPEQLRLELQWDYLNRLTDTSEKFDSYESTSQVLLSSQRLNQDRGPVWEEINTSV